MRLRSQDVGRALARTGRLLCRDGMHLPALRTPSACSSRRRNQEMRFLEGIASAKQLQTPAAAKLVEATYSLTMCEFTRDLLFTFLQGSKMPLILAIVVENLRIHVEGRPPMQVRVCAVAARCKGPAMRGAVFRALYRMMQAYERTLRC